VETGTGTGTGTGLEEVGTDMNGIYQVTSASGGEWEDNDIDAGTAGGTNVKTQNSNFQRTFKLKIGETEQ
jgi:hypothetical protein